MKARGRVLMRRFDIDSENLEAYRVLVPRYARCGGSYGDATGLMTRIVDEPSLDGPSLMRENRTERFFN